MAEQASSRRGSEETIELAHQAIGQTRAEIARSQALSQAEADLVQAIDLIAEEHGDPADR
jgi:NACalpha-BTF3-like transcription factor